MSIKFRLRTHICIRRTACAALAIFVVISTEPANAQGFLNKLKAVVAPAADEQPSDNAVSGSALVRSFVTSNTELLQAQEYFAEAFGLKDQAGLLRAERESLSSGVVDNSKLKKVRSTSEEAQRQLDIKMTEETELSTEGRVFYAKGFISLGAALLEGRKTLSNANQFAANSKRNPLTLLSAEGRSAGYVAKEAPGYFTNLKNSTTLAITYGTRNHIEAPADATSMLSEM